MRKLGICIQWDLKSDHVKYRLCDGQFSNGPALAMAIAPTI